MEPRAARNAMARQEARFSRPSAKSGSADLVSSRARWFDLPGHGEEIDLAGLDVFLGELKSFSVDQNARVVCVIHPSNREAGLTVSPITLKDRLFADPIVATTRSPVVSTIHTLKSGRLQRRPRTSDNCSWNSRMVRCCSSSEPSVGGMTLAPREGRRPECLEPIVHCRISNGVCEQRRRGDDDPYQGGGGGSDPEAGGPVLSLT